MSFCDIWRGSEAVGTNASNAVSPSRRYELIPYFINVFETKSVSEDCYLQPHTDRLLPNRLQLSLLEFFELLVSLQGSTWVTVILTPQDISLGIHRKAETMSLVPSRPYSRVVMKTSHVFVPHRPPSAWKFRRRRLLLNLVYDTEIIPTTVRIIPASKRFSHRANRWLQINTS